jgi:1-acyl-sn-glycerol-3-phosphate acyltransferase
MRMLWIEKQMETSTGPYLPGSDEKPITPWFGESLRRMLLFPALWMVAPLRVEGVEHLQGKGPYIFAANHSSHLDAPLLLAALPTQTRLHTRVAAAADYFFTNRWKGALMRTILNAFAFERKGPGRAASLEHAQRLLSGGQHLLIFPEGTRSKDGQLQPFKWGVGKLALAGSFAVIPVHIEGAHDVLPKGTHWPRRQQVVVRFGKPMRFSASDDPAIVTMHVEQAVRNLAPSSGLALAA